ncbi:hypothetical protein C7M84_020597 [Penaeus vannamei]|uniref:Uncharacterized protein n=1 Tax=Penaeus vannamei TaxID=6689 RepID=A0A423SBN1_PENVA|nr:hypothetical protein C7M84_020597 [Penaeus vannamei]
MKGFLSLPPPSPPPPLPLPLLLFPSLPPCHYHSSPPSPAPPSPLLPSPLPHPLSPPPSHPLFLVQSSPCPISFFVSPRPPFLLPIIPQSPPLPSYPPVPSPPPSPPYTPIPSTPFPLLSPPPRSPSPPSPFPQCLPQSFSPLPPRNPPSFPHALLPSLSSILFLYRTKPFPFPPPFFELSSPPPLLLSPPTRSVLSSHYTLPTPFPLPSPRIYELILPSLPFPHPSPVSLSSPSSPPISSASLPPLPSHAYSCSVVSAFLAGCPSSLPSPGTGRISSSRPLPAWWGGVLSSLYPISSLSLSRLTSHALLPSIHDSPLSPAPSPSLASRYSEGVSQGSPRSGGAPLSSIRADKADAREKLKTFSARTGLGGEESRRGPTRRTAPSSLRIQPLYVLCLQLSPPIQPTFLVHPSPLPPDSIALSSPYDLLSHDFHASTSQSTFHSIYFSLLALFY